MRRDQLNATCSILRVSQEGVHSSSAQGAILFARPLGCRRACWRARHHNVLASLLREGCFFPRHYSNQALRPKKGSPYHTCYLSVQNPSYRQQFFQYPTPGARSHEFRMPSKPSETARHRVCNCSIYQKGSESDIYLSLCGCLLQEAASKLVACAPEHSNLEPSHIPLVCRVWRGQVRSWR